MENPSHKCDDLNIQVKAYDTAFLGLYHFRSLLIHKRVFLKNESISEQGTESQKVKFRMNGDYLKP